MRGRITCVRWFGWSLLATAWGAIALHVAAEEKPVVEEAAKVVWKPFEGVPEERLAEWKKKYAFESLRGRLAYEKSDRVVAKPKVDATVAENLKQRDALQSWNGEANRRAISLAPLHGENVDRFINRPGFGFSRMPMPGPSYLDEEPNAERIPFAAVTPLSEGERLVSSAAPLVSATVGEAVPANPWRMPSTEVAFQFHSGMENSFVRFDRFGYFKSIDQVAGFEPHGFRTEAHGPIDDAKVTAEGRLEVPWNDDSKRWKIARMELVSLLKHDTPRVYVSDHLPRMEDLSSVKTRALSAFESKGLQALVEGKDLDAESTPNRIDMVGALRASKQCMQCHQVPHGTLLGAFSYELRRDSPIVERPAKVGPVQ